VAEMLDLELLTVNDHETVSLGALRSAPLIHS
jgi:hypothetical protein